MIHSIEIKGNKTTIKSTDLDGNKYNDTFNVVSDALRVALQNCAPVIKQCYDTNSDVFCTGVIYGVKDEMPAVQFVGTVYDNFLGEEYVVKTNKINLSDEVRDGDTFLQPREGGFATNLRGELVPRLNSYVLDQLETLSITAEQISKDVKRQMTIFEVELNG